MAKLVSKTYGDALFEAGIESQKIDELFEDVKAAGEILSQNMELLRLIGHPKIGKEEKIRVIEKIFKGRVLDELTGLLVIVITKGREKDLFFIFEYFMKRYREVKQIGVAKVISAMELDSEWKRKIERKLLTTAGFLEMEMSYEVDESLLGGLVIQIGDRVVDSSLKSRLENLKGELMNKKEGGKAS